MKTVGIIAEYNPFHNGHLYQMTQARRLTGADYCIVVMSGPFVQRGEPAVFDKYSRTKAALACGADLVIELPVCYATSSAEGFASGAVALLDHLGCDFLCFGSECGSAAELTKAAGILAEEPPLYQTYLQEALRKGAAYPAAVGEALSRYAGGESSELTGLLESPNNLLGIEYIKALIRRQSPMKPVAITRIGQGYHASVPAEPFSSATAIRNSIRESTDKEQMSQWIPTDALDFCHTEHALWADDFSSMLNYKRLYIQNPEEYAGISQDFANRLSAFALKPMAFSSLIQEFKTRQLTYGHVSRGLLHILLDIRKEDMELGASQGCAPYLRILGVRKESTSLLRHIKAHTDRPLINKVADAPPDRLLQLDIQAAHLYRSVLYHKTGHLLSDEYRTGICIL